MDMITGRQILEHMLEHIRRERMDNTYYPTPDEWRRQMERYGYRLTDRGLTGDAKPSQETKPVLVQSNASANAEYRRMLMQRAQEIERRFGQVSIPKPTTIPLTPSTPKSVEPDKDHIWNMIVLAAQSSRYGS
jgi:Asp-tRNA(Asn)/Glu-tRNA(Gln) amidotransferase A subunit family amidase